MAHGLRLRAYGLGLGRAYGLGLTAHGSRAPGVAYSTLVAQLAAKGVETEPAFKLGLKGGITR